MHSPFFDKTYTDESEEEEISSVPMARTTPRKSRKIVEEEDYHCETLPRKGSVKNSTACNSATMITMDTTPGSKRQAHKSCSNVDEMA